MSSGDIRRRFLIRFGGLLGGALVAIGAGLWLGYSRVGGDAGPFIVAGLAAGFAVAGLVVWAAFVFDDAVAKPVQRLAADLRARARADVGTAVEPIQCPHLGGLADAGNELVRALQSERTDRASAVAGETAKVNRQKALFEALLHDLINGVLVLTPDNRIMLYNATAQELLPGLGLDRPIASFLRDEPLLNAFKRMHALRERGLADTVEFLVAAEQGERFFMMRAGPVVFEAETIGTVLIFHDTTDDLTAHADHDHLFNGLLEDVRHRVAAIGAVSDVMQAKGDLDTNRRQAFTGMMRTELDQLFSHLREMSSLHDAMMARLWPTTVVDSTDIFDALAAKNIGSLRLSGKSQFMNCDGFAILGLLAQLLTGLAGSGTRYDYNFAAEPRGDQVWLSLAWSGDMASEDDIEAWLGKPLSHGYGEYSGRDVLLGHRTDVWSEADGLGFRLVLPLVGAHAPGQLTQRERAEFYDFDLPPVSILGDVADVPLENLRFVVFDTETTGLEPGKGDDIIQIAGVRIVNKRILRGEVFDTFVDPKRPIPPVSTEIHGITDDMIVGAPDTIAATRDFHDFCHDAVLVAHNAPFDMAFLKKTQAQAGVTFDQPVLCTVLLSAALYDHAESHTLDALTDRLGVKIPPNMRHTAIGDTVATAEVFVRLMDVLQGQGITTLGGAMEAADRMVNYRKAQRY